MFFVLDQEGKRYGPADLNSVRSWYAEGFILPYSTIEDARTKQQTRLWNHSIFMQAPTAGAPVAPFILASPEVEANYLAAPAPTPPAATAPTPAAPPVTAPPVTAPPVAANPVASPVPAPPVATQPSAPVQPGLTTQVIEFNPQGTKGDEAVDHRRNSEPISAAPAFETPHPVQPEPATEAPRKMWEESAAPTAGDAPKPAVNSNIPEDLLAYLGTSPASPKAPSAPSHAEYLNAVPLEVVEAQSAPPAPSAPVTPVAPAVPPVAQAPTNLPPELTGFLGGTPTEKVVEVAPPVAAQPAPAFQPAPPPVPTPSPAAPPLDVPSTPSPAVHHALFGDTLADATSTLVPPPVLGTEDGSTPNTAADETGLGITDLGHREVTAARKLGTLCLVLGLLFPIGIPFAWLAINKKLKIAADKGFPAIKGVRRQCAQSALLGIVLFGVHCYLYSQFGF